jgi:hypothetical protein
MTVGMDEYPRCSSMDKESNFSQDRSIEYYLNWLAAAILKAQSANMYG